MDWINSINEALDYIELHIYDDINVDDVCTHVGISSFYFQKSFVIFTGYSLSEYIRNRRLYLASIDLRDKKMKIIDVAYKYYYETPESFTKAFKRFHGVTPKTLKNNKAIIRVFLPLTFSLNISGGEKMDYKIEEMKSFKIIGFEHQFSFDNAYNNIPKFWDEIVKTHLLPLFQGKAANTPIQKACVENCISEFALCIDDGSKKGCFKYVIGGVYKGGDIPQGLSIFEVPGSLWSKFKVVGPNPTALQDLNTKIFKDWLPNNKEYKFAGTYNLEWYSVGDVKNDSYESGIWIPIVKK